MEIAVSELKAVPYQLSPGLAVAAAAIWVVTGSGLLTRSATVIWGIVVRRVWARPNVSSACDKTLRPVRSSRAWASSAPAASSGNSAMYRLICWVRLTNGFLDKTTEPV